MRFVAIVVAVIAACAAWTGYWFFAAGQLRDGINDWAAAQGARGVDVSYATLAVTGYPFRLRVEIGAPQLVWRRQPGAPAWRSDVLTGIAHPWDLQRILIDLSGRHLVRYQRDDQPHTAEITVGQGQSSYTGNGRGELQRLSVDLNGVALRVDDQAVGSAARVQLHTRPNQRADAVADIAISLADARITEPADLPLGQHIAGAEAQVTLVGTIPDGAGAESVARWRDDGGIVEVEKLRLVWGDVRADANGTVALDNEMRPLGALTARVRGHNALLDAAVAAGQMSPDAGSTAKVALGLLAAAGGGTLAVPVKMQDGTAFLGPVAVAKLSPVF